MKHTTQAMLKRTLISLCVGMSFSSFGLSALMGLPDVISIIISVIPVALGIMWLQKERKSNLFLFKFIVIGIFFSQIMFWLSVYSSFPIPLFAVIDVQFISPFLGGCGLFALALLAAYVKSKASSLTLLFLTMAVMFLSFAPLIAMNKQEIILFGGYSIGERYAIPIALTSIAFSLWGITSALHSKFSLNDSSKRASDGSINLPVDKLETQVGNNRLTTMGLLLVLIAPLFVVAASYAYLPDNFSFAIFASFAGFDFCFLLAFAGVALFIFGAAVTINPRLKLSTALVAAGSCFLFAGGFANFYQAPIVTWYFGNRMLSYSPIFRFLAFPLLALCVGFLIAGFILILKEQASKGNL